VYGVRLLTSPFTYPPMLFIRGRIGGEYAVQYFTESSGTGTGCCGLLRDVAVSSRNTDGGRGKYPIRRTRDVVLRSKLDLD